MEGLSIEEKARRYDEALEYAKKLLKTIGNATLGNLVLKNEFKNMFPALEESEDERIRKFIKDVLDSYGRSIKCPTKDILLYEKSVAWLEKQGSKESVTCPICGWEIKKQGEQKPADKIESRQKELTEFEKAVKQVMEEAIECGDTHNLKADADMLLRLVQKSSWSEGDKEMSRFIGNAITVNDASIYLESKGIQVIDAHVWLNGLKDRVQPKQEWSDYDECMLANLIDDPHCSIDSEYVHWLKSLKERYSWKPSDEQMLAINTAINVLGKGTINGKYLVELHEQLLKLREE